MMVPIARAEEEQWAQG